MITSAQNKTIQWVRKLQTQKKERESSGCYAVEGIRLTEAVFEAGEPLKLVLYSLPVTDRIQAFLSQVQSAGIETEEITESLMRSITDTETPQGILAVAKLTAHPIPKQPSFTLVLDAIHDPGNLGTLIRTAKAAGVDAMLLAPGCADPSAPKVIRSAMGAHCSLPIAKMDWEQIQQFTDNHKTMRIFAAEMTGGKSLWEQDLKGSVMLIIGSEAHGISTRAEKIAHDKIFIPMAAGVESLNAAVAAGVLMFEVARQRNHAN